MDHQYQAVQWNKNKIVYDVYAVMAVVLFIAIFITVGLQTYPSGHTADPVVLLIRALGVTAFSMLTVILSIGPLARLSARFLPILYNRRHLGVMTFIVASAHFGLALIWYHSGGPLNPFISLFVSNPLYDSIPGFPFEVLGFAAFLVLLLMAATSHDFWLNNLSAPVWKALHMLVYPAYVLLVLHIVLGALMTEKSIIYPIMTALAFGGVSALHLYTGLCEWRADNGMKRLKAKGWIDVAAPGDIPDLRAIIAPLPKGDRVAVFRYDNKISAVTNACRHQNGPLGEGRVIDGCITCPWHGWQYRPGDGVSPPPFTEKIATYNVKIENGRVFVDPKPNPPGTPTEPAIIPNMEGGPA
jgi:nitrite reductase/ring-hydroxylating ferredoxin subunit/DMSO/TMAO reductase YedYZ heme-binding membrane subunit